MSDSSVPPHDKGKDPPVQKNPVSRSSGVQSEKAVRGARRPTKQEAGTEAESPHGVGESTARSGEDFEDEKRAETGDTARRPHGRAKSATTSGVGASDPVDDESFHLPPGEEGG